MSKPWGYWTTTTPAVRFLRAPPPTQRAFSHNLQRLQTLEILQLMTAMGQQEDARGSYRSGYCAAGGQRVGFTNATSANPSIAPTTGRGDV
jgi:hypothetical protein